VTFRLLNVAALMKAKEPYLEYLANGT